MTLMFVYLMAKTGNLSTPLRRMVFYAGLQYASVIDGDYYETVLLTFASYFSMISLHSKLFLNMENIDIAS